jgi:hypothetical protein
MEIDDGQEKIATAEDTNGEEEIRTQPFCGLEHHQHPRGTDGKARVSEENVKSDIECMIFPIIPKAGYCCKLATHYSIVGKICSFERSLSCRTSARSEPDLVSTRPSCLSSGTCSTHSSAGRLAAETPMRRRLLNKRRSWGGKPETLLTVLRVGQWRLLNQQDHLYIH